MYNRPKKSEWELPKMITNCRPPAFDQQIQKSLETASDEESNLPLKFLRSWSPYLRESPV